MINLFKIINPSMDRLVAEASLMNCIRRLILLTQDVRPEDIQYIADSLDKAICQIISTIEKRSPYRNSVYRERIKKKVLDIKG